MQDVAVRGGDRESGDRGLGALEEHAMRLAERIERSGSCTDDEIAALFGVAARRRNVTASRERQRLDLLAAVARVTGVDERGSRFVGAVLAGYLDFASAA